MLFRAGAFCSVSAGDCMVRVTKAELMRAALAGAVPSSGPSSAASPSSIPAAAPAPAVPASGPGLSLPEPGYAAVPAALSTGAKSITLHALSSLTRCSSVLKLHMCWHRETVSVQTCLYV